MGIIVWVIIGIAAGWLAGQLMKGTGFGLIGDLVLGLVGAIIGGWLFGIVASPAEPVGFFGSIVVATVGAIILIFVARALGGGRTARA